MNDLENRVEILESKLSNLTKRLEDIEMDVDHARSQTSFFNQDALDQTKERLSRYVQDNPLQSLLVAIVVTAILVLIIT